MQALLLELVHRFHGLEQLGHIASLLGGAHQGLHIFGEAGAAVAAAGPDELETNTRIRANTNAHALDVGAEAFGHLGCGADRAKSRSGITPLGAAKGHGPDKWAGAAEAIGCLC